jgi:hypothetical protein
MGIDKGFYEVYTYGDSLKPGSKLKIERTISFKSANADLERLAALPLGELEQKRADSAGAEKAVFEQVQAMLEKWDEQAAVTMLVDKAIEYAREKLPEHSSNQWYTEEYGYKSVSNMVYKMTYNVYEEKKYDHSQKEPVPVAWLLTWSVRTNMSCSGSLASSSRIAGQDRKRFTDKAAMEKYLQGRIAAYAPLFTDVSPPIPPGYAKHFKVNGLLLPGYTVATETAGEAARAPDSEQAGNLAGGGKPSVLGRISEARGEERRTKAGGHGKTQLDRKMHGETEL